MSQLAADFIKAREGCKLTAYQDGGKVWTIGYGHTGPEVHQGLVWTQAQVDAALVADMAKIESKVRGLVHIPVGEQSIAALCSFAFNAGIEALTGATFLKLINAGDILGAAKGMIPWDHDNGKEVKGLLIRRFLEAALFLQGT